MRVLVACEFSGVVREAFRKRGHDAWSCDLLESEIDSPNHYGGEHFQRDVREILDWGWDLMIAHPPCTHLAVSGRAGSKTNRKNRKRRCGSCKTLWTHQSG